MSREGKRVYLWFLLFNYVVYYAAPKAVMLYYNDAPIGNLTTFESLALLANLSVILAVLPVVVLIAALYKSLSENERAAHHTLTSTNGTPKN